MDKDIQKRKELRQQFALWFENLAERVYKEVLREWVQ